MSGSGANPIEPPRRGADAVPMTVLDLLITTEPETATVDGPTARFGRRRKRAARRAVDESPRVAELRERVRSGEYAVDADAVAGAILSRLLAGDGRS